MGVPPWRGCRHHVLVTAKARVRRSSADVQRLILEAARELFVENGYEQTSTREIAARAGVIQAAVFRHFGTKDALFEHVVLAPLYEFVDEFVAEWARDDNPEQSARRRERAYVRGLLQLVRDNRVLFSMLANEDTDARFSRSGHLARSVLNRHLEDLERRSRAQVDADSRPVMDLLLAVRFGMALALGLGLFEDILFAADMPRPSLDELADELADYIWRATVLRTSE
jgi:AcrR family transcriptional regulator